MFCRKVDISEIGTVVKLYYEAENIEYVNNTQFQKIESQAQEIYKKMLERGSYTFGCFVTKEVADIQSTKLVGVINVNKILDYYPNYQEYPYVHLETFIIKEKFKNKGVGTFLFQNVLEQIKKEGCTYVIIQSDNEYVQKIAKKVGLSSTLKDMRYNFIKGK